MEFSRQEYWSGWSFPSLRDLPSPGTEPGSAALQADSLPSEPGIRLAYSYLLNLFSPGGFPGGSDDKKSACNSGDLGLILGSGRCPEEGNGYSLHSSCLENSRDTGAWQAIVHGVAKSWTGLQQLSMYQSATLTNILPLTNSHPKC